eukprot:1161097-Pelagomonas_calceolata.AAC.14
MEELLTGKCNEEARSQCTKEGAQLVMVTLASPWEGFPPIHAALSLCIEQPNNEWDAHQQTPRGP